MRFLMENQIQELDEFTHYSNGDLVKKLNEIIRKYNQDENIKHHLQAPVQE